MNIYLVLGAVAVAAVAGWTAKGWHEDSLQLEVERASQKIADNAISRESALAGIVEERLSQLKASEKIIDRGVIREIEKPIYQRVCLEPGAIRLLNAAARGESIDNTSEPAGALPGTAQPAK